MFSVGDKMGTMTIYGLKTTAPANHFTKMDTTRIRVYFIKKKRKGFSYTQNMEYTDNWIILRKHTPYLDTSYLSVFSPNAGKYGPEKTSYLDTFHRVT